MRRRLTRRTTTRTARNVYDEEEEEGYGSGGEYDDGPFELVKIRIKVGFSPSLELFELDANPIVDSSTTKMMCVAWP